MNANPPVIASAIKVLEGLEIICQAPRALSLDELADLLSVSRPTAYRVVNTLAEAGFAKPQGFRQGYVATMKVMGLGSRMTDSFDFRSAVRQAFRPVGVRFGETITVAKADGLEVVFVDELRAGSSLVFYCDIGRNLPLHLGAAGRSVMAHLTDEEFEVMLRTELISRTESSLTAPEQLRRARRKAREEGYVVSVDEVDQGVSAVAVPILDPSGIVLGAVAIANTSSAWTEGDRQIRGQAMRTAASFIFDGGDRTQQSATG